MISPLPRQLRTHVEAICAHTPRDIGHPENLYRVADYIEDHCEQIKWADRETQEFTASLAFKRQEARWKQVVDFENILLYRKGHTNETVVVGAHFDAVSTTPGADDDASGVAVLLELARLLLGPPNKTFERSLILAFYTGEEYLGSAACGSRRHAESLKDVGANIHVMISLEMLGYYTSRPNSQRVPRWWMRPFIPTTGNFLNIVGGWKERHILKAIKKSSHLFPTKALWLPESVGGWLASDHASFRSEGYPGLIATDTAYWRNPNYHDKDDTPDTLNYEAMALVTHQLYQILRYGLKV